MRIVIHHTEFYDWEPVPDDVQVTDADIRAGKVKPLARGAGWLMKVTKEIAGGTHTQLNLPEEQILAKIVHDKTRPEGGRILSRKEAVALFVAENILPHQAPRKSLTKFEVHDDGPDEKLARAFLAPHIEANNIEKDDLEEHIAAYLEPTQAVDHVDHLHTHFKIKAVTQ
jgi:hypothetical protein